MKLIIYLLFTGVIMASEPVKKLQICPNKPNCVSSLENESTDHKIEGLIYKSTLQETKDKLKVALNKAGEAKFTEESPYYWHIEFRSRLLRFVDDVEIVFDEENKIIHIRSASRVGHSDFGVNRKRVEKIRENY